MQERFKAWGTKYALTDGISSGTAEDIGDRAIHFYGQDGSGPFFVYGNDWHRTE